MPYRANSQFVYGTSITLGTIRYNSRNQKPELSLSQKSTPTHAGVRAVTIRHKTKSLYKSNDYFFLTQDKEQTVYSSLPFEDIPDNQSISSIHSINNSKPVKITAIKLNNKKKEESNKCTFSPHINRYSIAMKSSNVPPINATLNTMAKIREFIRVKDLFLLKKLGHSTTPSCFQYKLRDLHYKSKYEGN